MKEGEIKEARYTVETYYKGFRILLTQPFESGAAIVGLLDKMVEAGFKPGSNGDIYKAPEAPEKTADNELEETPMCPTHQKAMVKRKGQYGEFWACPTKMPSGEWCKAKPPKK
jgi:hypothetical protein